MFLAQRLVRLCDLDAGLFVPAPHETKAEFRSRILEQEQRADDGDGYSKVLEYWGAAERGAVMPPVFVLERDGVLGVVDGWHRCAVAGLRGRAAVRAVLVRVDSVAQENAVGEALFELSCAGTPWQAQVQAIEQLLAA